MSDPSSTDTNRDAIPADPESLRALYAATTEVAHAFFEWRHKVISLYLLAVGGIFFFAGWIHDHQGLRQFLSVPFILGAAISCTLAFMDRANSSVLSHCYQVAKDIETELRPPSGAIFSALSDSLPKRLIYSKILRVVYAGSAIAFTLAATALIRWPLK